MQLPLKHTIQKKYSYISSRYSSKKVIFCLLVCYNTKKTTFIHHRERSLFMKQIAIIAACLIAHSIPSFAAQHVPGLQTCIGTPEMRHWFEQMQCKKLKADQQKNKADRQKN